MGQELSGWILILRTTHVNDFHLADVKSLINVLSRLQNLGFKNIVGVAFGLDLKLSFHGVLHLLCPLVLCLKLVVEGLLLSIILHLLKLLLFGFLFNF